jgi:Cu(I)/Ag(I) efflux system protein CusF
MIKVNKPISRIRGRRAGLFSAALASSLIGVMGVANAQEHSHHSQHGDMSNSSKAEWTLAEIRKIDHEQGRITLRHERIESLNMDSMTMVFRLAEGVSVEGFAEGAKVRFKVIKDSGRLAITELELVSE